MPKRIGSGIGRIAFLAAVIVAVIAALFNNYLADYYAVIVVVQVLLGIVVVVLLLIRALRMSNNFKSLAGLSKSLDGAPKTGKGSSSGNNS